MKQTGTVLVINVLYTTTYRKLKCYSTINTNDIRAPNNFTKIVLLVGIQKYTFHPVKNEGARASIVPTCLATTALELHLT